MIKGIYGIFKDCFPDLPVTEEILSKLMEYESCVVLTQYEGDVLAGFCAVRKDRIVLLCVSPGFRHRGHGKELLGKGEELIRAGGYAGVTIGGAESGLFLGEVVSEADWLRGEGGFFCACGYTRGKGFVEMYMKMEDFRLDGVRVPENAENITYQFWEGDKAEILQAVEQVDSDWVQYFRPDVPIYVAMEEGKCAGFVIIGFDDITLRSNGSNKIGNIGCVGVVPRYRKGGLGLALVAHAAEELKKHGCHEGYIHYTSLDKWYAKLGYGSFLWYFFAHKIF